MIENDRKKKADTFNINSNVMEFNAQFIIIIIIIMIHCEREKVIITLTIILENKHIFMQL